MHFQQKAIKKMLEFCGVININVKIQQNKIYFCYLTFFITGKEKNIKYANSKKDLRFI